jgi:hypothetical protein
MTASFSEAQNLEIDALMHTKRRRYLTFFFNLKL